MQFKADEIASVLREEIAGYKRKLDVARVGRVIEVGDGIAQVFGISEAMAGEMLRFESGAMGQVFNLLDSSVGVVIYGGCEGIKEGDTVRATGELLEVPVGDEMLGRVVDPLGNPLDGGAPIHTQTRRPVEIVTPGIVDRQPVDEPMQTGIMAIDSMMPMGRGQRELIIGDRKTGKTAIAIDTIINHHDTDVVCVYVAIGQKESSVAAVVDTLKAHDAMAHTIVVSACSSHPAPLQYVAPYCGCAIAEHFMYRGRATLVVYDDLTKQAAAYRQISLLLRRPPGREAYPGDVFYLHSRLLERSCKLAEQYVIAPATTPDDDAPEPEKSAGGKVYIGPLGFKEARASLAKMADAARLKVHRQPASGGSMTALPICETQEGDVSAYIPTNLISITDGQIYLEPSLFFAGVRPAINVGISVSRVGYKAAPPAMREVAASLRLDMAAFRELESFSQLGMELDAATRRQLDRGERLVRLLTQGRYKPIPAMHQVIIIAAAESGHMDDLKVGEVGDYAAGLVQYIRAEHPDIYEELIKQEKFDKPLRKRLNFVCGEYKDVYLKERAAKRKKRRKSTEQ